MQTILDQNQAPPPPKKKKVDPDLDAAFKK